MKQLSLAFLLTFTSCFAMGQSGGQTADDRNSLQQYAAFDFKGQFAALVGQSGHNNVYLVDFSVLPTRFERVFFMNLSFGSYEIVNMDPTVTDDRVRFMSDRKNTEQDVLQVLAELRERTRIAAGWPEDQKKSWLQTNDKYK